MVRLIVLFLTAWSKSRSRPVNRSILASVTIDIDAMDYLDPVKKRAHKIRLMIGYGLMAVVIGLSTLILLYLGSGYYFDRENGGLLQNGLLYIDAKPESAQISLNSKLQRSSTSARLVVPSGNYSIQLSRDGYRPWSRSIELGGGEVRRLAYPRLVPVSLKTDAIQTFAERPDFVSQSINREFILMRFASAPLTFLVIDSDQPTALPAEIVLPAGTLADPAQSGAFEAVEWARNDRHVLLGYRGTGGLEYILLDRNQPELSRNLSRQFGLSQTAALRLHDGSNERFVVHDTAVQTVSITDINQTTAGEVVLRSVLAVESFEDNKFLYVTPIEGLADKSAVRLLLDGKDYLIREVAVSDRYLLAISNTNGTLALAAGSQADDKVAVYFDPVGYLARNQSRKLPLASTILRVDRPEYASFSVDSSVIVVRGGAQFASYEFEADRSYNFSVKGAFDSGTNLRWMDGARFNYTGEGVVYSVDFDGSNVEKLVPAESAFGVYYDRPYDNLFSFVSSPENTLFQITNTSLKAQ